MIPMPLTVSWVENPRRAAPGIEGGRAGVATTAPGLTRSKVETHQCPRL